MAKKKIETSGNVSRQEAFFNALKTIGAKYKDVNINRFADLTVQDVERISTGSLIFDKVLDGGLGKGRIVEIYGPEGSGKTTVALSAVATIQRAGGNALFIDAENAINPVWCRKIGVDMNNLGFCQPSSAEEIMEIIDQACESKLVDIIVVDSVASMVTKAELEEEDYAKAQVGTLARVMSKSLKKLTKKIADANCCLIFTNQIRDNIGVMYGDKTSTPGGKALKFYASQRISVKKRELKKDGTDIVAVVSEIECKKNKLGKPFNKGLITISLSEGISRVGEIFKLALDYGIIQKVGQKFYCQNPTQIDISGFNAKMEDEETVSLGTYEKNAFQEVKQNKALFDMLVSQVTAEFNERNNYEGLTVDEEDLDELDEE